MITASLSNYRISPRKIRLVADMIRGKKVADARIILTHVIKKSKHPLRDLLDSAIANAIHNYKMNADDLYVKEIMVNQGYILKRSMPMSRGTAFPIKKRTSHINIVLAPLASRVKKSAKKSKKVVKTNNPKSTTN